MGSWGPGTIPLPMSPPLVQPGPGREGLHAQQFCPLLSAPPGWCSLSQVVGHLAGGLKKVPEPGLLLGGNGWSRPGRRHSVPTDDGQGCGRGQSRWHVGRRRRSCSAPGWAAGAGRGVLTGEVSGCGRRLEGGGQASVGTPGAPHPGGNGRSLTSVSAPAPATPGKTCPSRPSVSLASLSGSPLWGLRPRGRGDPGPEKERDLAAATQQRRRRTRIWACLLPPPHPSCPVPAHPSIRCAEQGKLGEVF